MDDDDDDVISGQATLCNPIIKQGSSPVCHKSSPSKEPPAAYLRSVSIYPRDAGTVERTTSGFDPFRRCSSMIVCWGRSVNVRRESSPPAEMVSDETLYINRSSVHNVVARLTAQPETVEHVERPVSHKFSSSTSTSSRKAAAKSMATAG
ncbi:hypothetical protein H101_04802 [Trichophyton interdigitale H6]|nr:hypothetical protein H101_04802 [Trichophyton interdigitale H6]